MASVWAGTLLVKNFYTEMESVQGFKKVLTVGLGCSGYLVLTLTANIYLFN